MAARFGIVLHKLKKTHTASYESTFRERSPKASQLRARCDSSSCYNRSCSNFLFVAAVRNIIDSIPCFFNKRLEPFFIGFAKRQHKGFDRTFKSLQRAAKALHHKFSFSRSETRVLRDLL